MRIGRRFRRRRLSFGELQGNSPGIVDNENVEELLACIDISEFVPALVHYDLGRRSRRHYRGGAGRRRRPRDPCNQSDQYESTYLAHSFLVDWPARILIASELDFKGLNGKHGKQRELRG